jgi:hypothetical protein
VATRKWGKRLLVGILSVTVIAVLALALVTTMSSVSSGITSEDQMLEAKALEWARINGLQGTPVAKRAVRMTLGQWFALLNQQLGPEAAKFGLTPDMLVYILAIRGKVERRESQSPLQGQTTPMQLDNITVAIGVRTGKPISAGSVRDLSMMPIPVPLNALTPAAPIRYAPTLPLVTPPTLPPSMTLTPTPIQSALPTPTLPAK